MKMKRVCGFNRGITHDIECYLIMKSVNLVCNDEMIN